MTPQDGIRTAHGLAGFIGLCILVVLAFHFMGLRFVFTLGRGA